LEVRDDVIAGCLVFDENSEAGRRRLRIFIRAMGLPVSDAKYLCDLVAAASSRAAL
jgi:hypothetical protein